MTETKKRLAVNNVKNHIFGNYKGNVDYHDNLMFSLSVREA